MKDQSPIALLTADVIFAAAGYLLKHIIDEDRFARLENELAKSQFKMRVYRHSFEAAMKEVPDDRVASVRAKIETDVEFEQLIADQK